MSYSDDVQDILDGFDYDPDEPPVEALECTCGAGPDDCVDDDCQCWICHVYPYAD